MRIERNDPTRAGFTPPATGDVRLSAGEIEALCQKAARGAGYPWGLAEEAGFAARWLHGHGLDGCGALLAHLDTGVSSGVAFDDGTLSASKPGPLSPVVVGVALSDFASLAASDVTARSVDQPVLVLPFLHQIAAASGAPVALMADAVRVSVSPAGELAGDVAALAAAGPADLAVSPRTTAQPAAPPRPPCAPGAETVRRLNDYAMRTCVPASASSRTDAGSADGDND